jgi:acyl-coenzyme A synthetase/AMP-(fatty) acid ligase
LTSDQYAYVLADLPRACCSSRALLPVVKDMVGRMPGLEHVVVSGNDAHGHKDSPTSSQARPIHSQPPRPMRTRPAFWLYSSGSTGMPKGVRPRIQSRRHRKYLCKTGARHSRGRRLSLGGSLFFAYGSAMH